MNTDCASVIAASAEPIITLPISLACFSKNGGKSALIPTDSASDSV